MEFHNHRIHEDNRRKGAYDVIPGLSGDMNFTVQESGVVPHEWHMHKLHTDYFTLITGRILFRLVYEDGRPEEKFVMTAQDHKTLMVRPGIWHNYMALERSIMIFYITHKFDVADEFRRPCDSEGWNM